MAAAVGGCRNTLLVVRLLYISIYGCHLRLDVQGGSQLPTAGSKSLGSKRVAMGPKALGTSKPKKRKTDHDASDFEEVSRCFAALAWTAPFLNRFGHLSARFSSFLCAAVRCNAMQCNAMQEAMQCLSGSSRSVRMIGPLRFAMQCAARTRPRSRRTRKIPRRTRSKMPVYPGTPAREASARLR